MTKVASSRLIYTKQFHTISVYLCQCTAHFTIKSSKGMYIYNPWHGRYYRYENNSPLQSCNPNKVSTATWFWSGTGRLGMLLRRSRRRTQNPGSAIDLDIRSQVKIIGSGREEKSKTTTGMRVLAPEMSWCLKTNPPVPGLRFDKTTAFHFHDHQTEKKTNLNYQFQLAN